MRKPVPKLDRKKFYASLKKHIPFIVLAFVFILVSVVISIIAPDRLSDITNAITKGQATRSIDIDVVRKASVTLIVMYAVSAITSYSANFIFTTIAQKYSEELRNGIQNKINRMPLRYFDSHAFGDILSILTNDVDTLSQSLQNSLGSLFNSIFTLILVIIIMFTKSWALALTIMASLPFMIIMMLLLVKLGMPQFRKRQKLLGDVNGIIEENYSGQLIIKAFGAEKRINAGFEDENRKLSDAMFKADLFSGMMMPVMNFISYAAYALVCLVGGLLLVDGKIDYGTITAFLVYVNLFQSPLAQIAQAVNSLQSGVASAARVFSFLDEEELADETDKKPLLQGDDHKEQVQGHVIFNHVSFGYEPNREIIHDFNADVKPGYKVAIVGPTGAGKTTMVNLLMRFYETKSGDITIDGKSIKDMPREEIHDIFGMVLQDTWIFEGTIRENLIYNTKNVTDDQINEVLKKTDLAHYVSTLPNGLDYVITSGSAISAGERQLITIARAMIRKAPLLILDEATSNVDTRTEKRIQSAMDELTKGRTSFVIAHRLSTILNANLILVMKDGNIVEQGTHEELMKKNGFYASLYNSQFALE